MANKFSTSRAAENALGKQLRRVARNVGDMIAWHTQGSQIVNPAAMTAIAKMYSESLDLWARKTVANIVGGIAKRNEAAWMAGSKLIGREAVRMSASTVGLVAEKIQTDVVDLIKSIPLEAAERAQAIAREAAVGGKRVEVAARQIAESAQVSESRATLIARTEMSKANASFTRARAGAIGVTRYIWRTMGDADVRDSHSHMDGRIFSFDDPPEIDGEGQHGPGEFPNCRCYAEPLFD